MKVNGRSLTRGILCRGAVFLFLTLYGVRVGGLRAVRWGPGRLGGDAAAKECY